MPVCTHKFPSLKLYYPGENIYVYMCMYAYHLDHVCICECKYIVYCV